MSTNNDRILAIALFTKRFGYAVFDGGELVGFGIKTLVSTSDVAAAGVQIKQLIVAIDPTVILLKEPSKHQHSSSVNRQLHANLVRMAQQCTAPVKTVSRDVANRILTGRSLRTNHNAFAHIAKIYPELHRFTFSANRSQREYNSTVLVTVAIGHVYVNGRIPRA